MEDTLKGFRFSFDRRKHILYLWLWGFWDKEVGEQFLVELREKIKQISAAHTTWYMLGDVTRFTAQPRHVQPLLKEAMASAKQFGMKKAARVVGSHLTELQIGRLSEESNFNDTAYFRSKEEAIQWLLAE
jgi:hypothetical protein